MAEKLAESAEDIIVSIPMTVLGGLQCILQRRKDV